jgi:hypothetical protein
MLAFGLAVTLGTASVLQKVAVAWNSGLHGDSFEVTDVMPPGITHPSSKFAGH